MRKFTLEQRITRLEKLLSNRKPVKKESRKVNRRKAKNESALRSDIFDALTSVFGDHFSDKGYYSSRRDWFSNLQNAKNYSNDMMVDDAIMWLASDYGYDADLLEDLRDDIADDLAQLADDTLGSADEDDDEDDWDDWDDDNDDEYDEYDESLKKNLKRRVTRM